MGEIAKGLVKWAIVLFALTFALNFDSQSVQGRRPQVVQNVKREAPESCHLRELELCSVGALSIFQNPNGLPVGQTEMTRQCEYLNESMKCFDDYSKNCLTRDQHKVVDLFTGSGLKIAAEFCSNESELRQNYTRHVECLRKIQRDYQRSCMTDFQVGFEGIHKMAHAKRLPLICCNLNRLKECIFIPIDYECGIAASTTVERLLEDLFGSIYNLPCRNYNSTNEVCLKMLPKIGSKPHTGRNVSALSRVISGFTNVPAQL